MKNCYLLICLILTITFSFQSSFAQDKNSGDFPDDIDDIITRAFYDEYLVGLKKVKISISDLPKELKEYGVTKDQLQTEAEIRLRRAGIYDERAFPVLRVGVKVTQSNNYSIGYELEFSLNEKARLERNNLLVFSKTWKRINVGDSEKNRIQIDIREKVGKYIDIFIEDLRTANSQIAKKNIPAQANKQATQQKPQTKTTQQDDSPFTAVYVGGNSPPTVEVFNDSNRTLNLDLGQGTMTAYAIPSGESQKINLTEGIYNFKASAPRVRNLEGQDTFKKGYVYTWRFTIITVPK